MSDKPDYGIIRNGHYTRKEMRRIEAHNERLKEHYTNCDVVPERSDLNVHFKSCEGSYSQRLDDLLRSGIVSDRGLRPDAIFMDEFLIDVNSAYFEQHGGYPYAKDFFQRTYEFCVKQAGGDIHILSAVMHADERNVALSEELGRDVWHYHLHVVYIPVVTKEIKYTKRCKDKALVGTVRDTVMQISHSKKWESAPLRDEDGNVLRTEKGKILYDYSYSNLQTAFVAYMKEHNFTDIERGVKGSKQMHLETSEYKRLQDMKRAAATAALADTLSTEVFEKAAELQHIERQITAGQKAVDAKLAALSQIKNDAQYFDFADCWRDIVQWILERLAAFIARKGHFRDRDAEQTLFDDIRNGITKLFEKLRQLCGYEYRTNIAPEQCESTQIMAELPSLEAQILSAQAAPKATRTRDNRGDLYLNID